MLSVRRLDGKQNIGEQFWHDQQSHCADENPGGENWIFSRPFRKQGKSFWKILGPNEMSLQRDQNSEHQKQQPKRRGEICANPREKMKSRYPMQPARPAMVPGQPSTSGGRAQRNPEVTAGILRSCRPGQAPF